MSQLQTSSRVNRTCGPNATYRKYTVIKNNVTGYGVKDMRHILNSMRNFEDVNEDTFMPHYGVTTGEFACFKTLHDQSRRDIPK